MGWIVAESLDRLLAQLNALAPNRSKASDGSIGDAAHASRDSDHNPWLVLGGQPLVTARDFTHDPAGGLDGQRLADTLVRARDSRIKYIIWNRRIIDSRPGNNPWQWMPYDGINPHEHHVHVSVVADQRCRDASPWMLPGLAGGGAAPAPPAPGLYCTYGDRTDHVMTLQRFMTSHFPSYNPYRPTGYFGDATRDGIEEFQRRTELTADGVVGPLTLAKLQTFGFTP